jgi:hypothetical protein
MPRSYRFIIVALGLILAGHHPNAEAQPQQAAPQERSAKALENIAATYDEQAERTERSPDSNPCEPGDDQRNSDLCAQWKAADAAADSAWWAAVGAFASAISTLLVLIALYLAFRSNWIARDTARRQLRAYVNVVSYVNDSLCADVPFKVMVNVKNKGQTPAAKVSGHVQMAFRVIPLKNNSFELDEPKDGRSYTSLASDEPMNVSNTFDRGFTHEEVFALRNGGAKLFVFGEVTYTDIFQKPQKTKFRADLGPDLKLFLDCEEGNDFT